MNTERIMELLKQFKNEGIRTGKKGLESVIEFQDLVGRCNTEEITEFYNPLDQRHRELFIWACTCCLSFDMAINIIKETTVREFKMKVIERTEEDFTDRNQALAVRELEIARREKTLNSVERKQKEIWRILTTHPQGHRGL